MLIAIGVVWLIVDCCALILLFDCGVVTRYSFVVCVKCVILVFGCTDLLGYV